MNQKLVSKIIATMLTVTLTFANFILLGMYTTKSYATSDDLEKQNHITNNENVEFDAYFKGEDGQKIHTLKQGLNTQASLYLAIKVKKGYLTGAKIQLTGEKEDANISILQNQEQQEWESVQKIQKDEIELKQINNNTDVVLEVKIEANQEKGIKITDFSKQNQVLLTGTYKSETGKEIAIQKAIQIRNEWTGSLEVEVEQQVKKYIPYEQAGKKGVMVQTSIMTGAKEASLPIKQTKIEVQVPEIEGEKPQKILVRANSTKATNGKEGNSLTQENWKYDSNTGKLEIMTNNEEQEGRVAWEKEGKDEYILTYFYGEKAKQETTTVKQEATVTIEAYNNVETKQQKIDTLTEELTKQKGELVSAEIKVNQEQMSKGFLYTKTTKEMEYEVQTQMEIGYADLMDQVILEYPMDHFQDEQGNLSKTAVGNTHDTYYKTTKLAKDTMLALLGEEGTITIKDQAGINLVTWNKDTNPDEQGNLTYTYEAQTSAITIETSKPILEGKLQFVHTKNIKGKTNYSKAQLQSFQALISEVFVTGKAQETQVSQSTQTTRIGFVEPVTKLELTTNKESLSTVVKNENVEWKVILKTDSITCDLYKNPIIELELPKDVKDIEINHIKVLFDDELKVDSYHIVRNSQGNVILQVKLIGEDTKYNLDMISKGANLIINANITLKELTPTKEENIKVYVTNENVTSYETEQNGKGYAQIKIKEVAPIGMVATNEISGYQDNQSVISISGQERTGKLEVKGQAKTATVNMNLINNYETPVTKIQVLGRIPFAGNQDIVTGEDLGSNITAKMKEAITVNGIQQNQVTIYYSTNGKATKEIQAVENSWTQNPENWGEVKSYLIVMDQEMETGKSIKISYPVEIEGNLSHNRSTYATYIAYFETKTEKENIPDKVVATKVGVTTGEGPELEVKLETNIANNVAVKEGDTLTYTATIKNIGKTAVEKVTIKIPVPEGSIYIENEKTGSLNEQTKEIIKTFDTIAVGETKTVEVNVQVEAMRNNVYTLKGQNRLTTQANAIVEGYDTTFESEQRQNNIEKGFVKLSIQTYPIPAQYDHAEGDEVTYEIVVENVNDEVKKNLTVKMKLPEGMTFQSISKSGNYDEKTRMLTWNLEELQGLSVATLNVTAVIEELGNKEYERELTTKVTLTDGSQEASTKEVTIPVKKGKLEIRQTSETQERVEEGKEIIYHIMVTNTGKASLEQVKVVDYLPQGVKYQMANYTLGGKNYQLSVTEEQPTITVSTLAAGETLEISLVVIVEGVQTETKVTNAVKVSAKGMPDTEANSVKHILVPQEKVSDENETQDPTGGGETIEGTYKISGNVWLDENRDGRREDTETQMKDIEVMLIHAENGEIVKDPATGEEKIQKTTSKGKYTFTNLKPGKYMVVFAYDTVNYALTQYRVEGVLENRNSDVIEMLVPIKGEEKQVGVSDTITITNQDMNEIDMGLILSPKFDLKLDKVVTKITVNDGKETKEHTYKDMKLAKLDLNPKTANNTNIVVEYKIRVTNEGAVAGYAKKIVDYIPRDMKFSSSLNPDWYASSTGDIYNSSLANELIQPGETKEITLLLTKKVDEDNLDIINNTAEIYEAYNDLGIQDIDSTPANKVQKEDDMSSADVILGVKTGQVYLYIGIVMLVITTFAAGIYIINRKVLRRV